MRGNRHGIGGVGGQHGVVDHGGGKAGGEFQPPRRLMRRGAIGLRLRVAGQGQGGDMVVTALIGKRLRGEAQVHGVVAGHRAGRGVGVQGDR